MRHCFKDTAAKAFILFRAESVHIYLPGMKSLDKENQNEKKLHRRFFDGYRTIYVYSTVGSIAIGSRSGS